MEYRLLPALTARISSCKQFPIRPQGNRAPRGKSYGKVLTARRMLGMHTAPLHRQIVHWESCCLFDNARLVTCMEGPASPDQFRESEQCLQLPPLARPEGAGPAPAAMDVHAHRKSCP